ncbi:MAG: hypothetical protein A3F83_14455 [Candidatus Glassbacteria bacterium RIFCSPLOWO2_12_FULL_58_11]|uniref:Uncharacterized protein n=1 Tax=Candidatus Glassbacteria bacterium RIFCSPLOWO2_12_FULL_58_11 TaxID=1817867 RepID=A0A1F5YS85_9BACT|nr:MAG: hypothetical protein A3F83_14455 [Candidatus Glassbacteria bacterium RIFCSPLOWO2_12_FULL_58_11]
MKNSLRVLVNFPFVLLAYLLFATSLSAGETFDLDGGGLWSRWDSATGRLLALEYHRPDNRRGTNYAFFDKSQGAGGLEIYDELEKVLYSDRRTPCRVSGLSTSRFASLQKVEFTKHFEGAPFAIQVTLTADASGIRIDTRTVLEQLPDLRWPAKRNVRVSFVLPAKASLLGWAPAYPEPARITEKPVRYCYGIQEPGLPRTGIPMYTLYEPGGAGMSLLMPLDQPKVQLNLGPEPEDPRGLYVGMKLEEPNAEAGLEYLTEPAKLVPSEIRVVRLTELFVGLAADRPLPFTLRLISHAPHWRPALGKVSELYPEYFSLSPRMRSIWNSRLGANVHLTDQQLAGWQEFGAASAWLHTHFHRHGEFIPPEAINDPDYTFFCEPYAKEYPDNTVRKNRLVIDRLCDNGQAVFLYGFNMHCDTVTVAQRGLFADLTRNIDGSITRSYHDQPVMFFNPASPYGSHLLRQMDLMQKVYPRIMGIALDNWAYGGIDFSHDDGITMFGHSQAASVNFSQQRMIGAIADKWHSTGRLVMVNKARTIESLKGADSMLSEASGAEIFAMFAYMCLNRHLHANEYDAATDAKYAEYTLKYSLEWGGQIGHGQTEADPEMTRHYYALLQALRNRTWVFDPDPLSLPEGTTGNIWRISPDSPWNPGDIVATVVRPKVNLADNNFREGLKVKVRLPEIRRITGASWLGAEQYGKPPIACRMEKKDGELIVSLPKVGAAGVLRLILE